jgi:ubiquinone/menaquinone biosynthesis C-methylase UbiE
MTVVELEHRDRRPLLEVADMTIKTGEPDNVCVLPKGRWVHSREKISDEENDARMIRKSSPDSATKIAKKRYDRVAAVYDLCESITERFGWDKWRELLWSKVQGVRILEVGVGTGKNFSYYPSDTYINAIDFNDKMLKHAKDRASNQRVKVHLQQMDVQQLEFGDNTFDTVVASLVFCSVPDPVRGLIEVKRVCKQGGKIVLLEHVISDNPILGWLMNLINPLVVYMRGSNINRRTERNVILSGLKIEKVADLRAGVLKLIEARK